jgi:hypothetical protein
MTMFAPRTHTPIPSMPGWPLLGNVFALRKDRLELLLRISREFGDIGAFHFGPRIVPLINAPDLVRCVLVDQSAMFEKTATVRKLAMPVLGNGVFLSEGEEHRQQRKLLAPLFQHRHALNYAETMVNCTSRLQERWQEGETINLVLEHTGFQKAHRSSSAPIHCIGVQASSLTQSVLTQNVLCLSESRICHVTPISHSELAPISVLGCTLPYWRVT